MSASLNKPFPSFFPSKQSVLDSNEIKLSCEVRGQGTPFVVSHKFLPSQISLESCLERTDIHLDKIFKVKLQTCYWLNSVTKRTNDNIYALDLGRLEIQMLHSDMDAEINSVVHHIITAVVLFDHCSM